MAGGDWGQAARIGRPVGVTRGSRGVGSRRVASSVTASNGGSPAHRPSDLLFCAHGSVGRKREDEFKKRIRKGRSMSIQSPTGVNFREAIQPVEDRRERARVIASFAEYLAEHAHGHPDRALEAMASLAEWCDDDPQLLEHARAHVQGDTRRATLSAQAVMAQNNRDALELLELAARAS